MRNEKKRHNGQKNFIRNKIEKYKKDNIYEKYSANHDTDEDKEKKIAHVYKLFYAELMKFFVIEAQAKDLNLTEVELDQNIFLSSDEYYKMNNDMYEVRFISNIYIKIRYLCTIRNKLSF